MSGHRTSLAVVLVVVSWRLSAGAAGPVPAASAHVSGPTTSPATTQPAASAFVGRVVGEAVGVLGNRHMPAAEKREKVRGLTLEALDFDALARLSLGRHWRDLNDRQRGDFTEAFKQHLINTCCDMTSGFTDEHVTVLGEREEARGDRTVNASVGGTDDNGNKVEYAKVEFRTRQTNGQWKVIDVSTMGVSLLAAFKVQFESLMVVGGYDRVMKLLHDKNAAAAAAATGPATRRAATGGAATTRKAGQ